MTENKEPCAHPKIEATLTTEGKNVLGGMVKNARKLVFMCNQGCGYMETIKMVEFGKINLKEYVYTK